MDGEAQEEMRAEWRKSGILQLEPESIEDVFKLADFIKSLENDDVKEAPSHLSEIREEGEQAALQGLPEYGVLLSGSPKNPIVENHSGKTVIGYVVKTADAHGRGPVVNQLMAHSCMQPAGIPDGGSLYAKGAVPVNSTVGMLSFTAKALSIGQGQPIVRAILQSVVFADGQFVGIDEHGAFDQFVERIKAIVEVAILARNGAWDQVEALAPLPPRLPLSLDLTAMLLVQERKFKGDAAAGRLAEIYSSLPPLWRGSSGS
jgi:hypothetical protein